MAITFVGSTELEYSSATPATSRTLNIATGTRTNGVLVVAVGVISASSGSGDVTGVTWNGEALTKAIETSSTIPFIDIWYLVSPDSGTNDLVVSYASGVTTTHIVAFWADSDSTIALGDTNTVEAGGTDPTSISLTPTVAGALVMSAYVSQDNNVATATSGTLVEEYDQGGNVFGSSYLLAPSTSAQTLDWDRNPTGISSVFNIAGAVFDETSSNEQPTIVANTADASTLSDTPTLEFTGSDADDDDLRYQIQISDNPSSFAGGDVLTEEVDTGGTGTLIIHPNPTGVLTWESHQQVDDRAGQVFQGHGGILDSIAFYFGAHETSPEDTDGVYLVSVYNADDGIRGDNIPVWQASTAYSPGDIVRNTSTANQDQQFAYVCSVGGTSGGTEPTWTEVEDDTISDNTVTWIAHRGAGPASPADAADTPTPGWIARSDTVAFAPGGADTGWKTCTFTGDQRVRLTDGDWYVAILDWRPANTTSTNTLTVSVRLNGTHAGNCYLDGATANNNGPRVGEDTVIRVYEEFLLLDKVSGTDAGFANTVNGGDTDPFNAGEKVSYTVQAGDALTDAITYYWQVRATDPGGTATWSSWTASRSFTVDTGGGTPHSLTASVILASSTPDNAELGVGRDFTASLGVTSASPDDAALGIDRSIAAAISVASASSDDAEIVVARDLGGSVAVASLTPDDGEIAIARAVAAAVTIASTTPDDAALSVSTSISLSASVALASSTPDDGEIGVARGLSGSTTVTTATPDDGGIAIARALAASVALASSTPDDAVLRTGIAFSAAVSLASSTSDDGGISVARGLAGDILLTTVTPDGEIVVARTIAAAVTLASSTPDDATLQTGVALSSSVALASSTPDDGEIAIARALGASVALASSTPDDGMLLVGVFFSSSVIVASSTPEDAEIVVARGLSSSTPVTTSTPDDAVVGVGRAVMGAVTIASVTPDDREFGIARLFLAAPTVSSATPDDGEIAITRGLSGSTALTTATPDDGALIVSRNLTAAPTVSSTTPDGALIGIDFLLTAVIHVLSITPDDADLSVETAAGAVSVAFGGRKAQATFTGRKPTITFSE